MIALIVPRTREQYNEYMRVYMLERYHRRRREGREFLGGVCVDCGTTEDLEFDHVDRESKEFMISGMSSCSEARFWAEVRKCVLRCKTCHYARTAQQLGVEHGGGASGKKNCPCASCKARKAEYMKRYYRDKSGITSSMAESPDS